MKEFLTEALQNGLHVAVYTDPSDTTKFAYGKLLCTDNENFAMYLISPDGEYDGILVQEIAAIQYLEISERYDRKIKTLCAGHSMPEVHIPAAAEDVKTDVLLYAKAAGKIVAIEVNSSGLDDLTGCVEKVEGNICKIKQVDPFGNEDGIAFADINRITQISCDSLNEQRILYLYAQKQKQAE